MDLLQQFACVPQTAKTDKSIQTIIQVVFFSLRCMVASIGQGKKNRTHPYRRGVNAIGHRFTCTVKLYLS